MRQSYDIIAAKSGCGFLFFFQQSQIKSYFVVVLYVDTLKYIYRTNFHKAYIFRHV